MVWFASISGENPGRPGLSEDKCAGLAWHGDTVAVLLQVKMDNLRYFQVDDFFDTVLVELTEAGDFI